MPRLNHVEEHAVDLLTRQTVLNQVKLSFKESQTCLIDDKFSVTLCVVVDDEAFLGQGTS